MKIEYAVENLDAPKCDRGCGRASVFRWSHGEAVLDLCAYCSTKRLDALTKWASEVHPQHEHAHA